MMIRESRYTDKNKLQYALVKTSRRRWRSREQIPEAIIKEYRQYLVDGQGRRGILMIVADIDEETKKLEKRYKPAVKNVCIPEGLMQEPASGKENPRVLEKILKNLKMVEKKKKHYYQKKKLEKKERLHGLRSNYSTRTKDVSKEPAN